MKKKMLIITPDLSLNGANVVLLELLELLKENLFFHVIASESGAFEEKLEKLEITYQINPTVSIDSIKGANYDFILLNTSSVHCYALYFQNLNVPVHWWFHESYEQLSNQRENFVHLALLSDNFHFYGVTPKVIRGLHDLYGVHANLLPMAIKDVYKETNSSKTTEKLSVFIPGAYTYIKGQDIMLAAIKMLPSELSNKYQFIFAGYKLSTQEDYYQKIIKISEAMPNVTILDQINRETVYRYYRDCVCVVAPSRIDSTPTTIVEALMHKKLCIVSSGAGISELMSDCQDGFIYENGNVNELFKRLLLVLTDYRQLTAIAQKGRTIYEENFLPINVEKRIRKYFDI